MDRVEVLVVLAALLFVLFAYVHVRTYIPPRPQTRTVRDATFARVRGFCGWISDSDRPCPVGWRRYCPARAARGVPR